MQAEMVDNKFRRNPRPCLIPTASLSPTAQLSPALPARLLQFQMTAYKHTSKSNTVLRKVIHLRIDQRNIEKETKVIGAFHQKMEAKDAFLEAMVGEESAAEQLFKYAASMK